MLQLNCNEFFKTSDATICSEVRSPQFNYPEHSHEFNELVIVSKGAGQHIINDIPTNLTCNYVCYVSPKDRHLYDQVNDLYLTNILFKKSQLGLSTTLKDYLPADRDGSVSWYITSQAMNRVNELLQRIEVETKLPTLEAKLMSEALFQQLVVELARGRLSNLIGNESGNVILQVIDWLQHHYSDDICINDIAEQFDISSRTLCRQMKQVTHLSFNNYVHRVRINHAMDLLLYSDKSITDIAFDVGYKDSNYFSTKFKRFVNRKPSEFRHGKIINSNLI
ncbi:helix-turn-helix domain-containing protein [Celerinatantimonas sp. MCCC 1A17872]|uniref:helix-turn-helix domain-containing protein n=1 Tax=Celerinatantimonas sp. MCCC 1A17872 TaxID=3177514 RepID=UPI0038CAEDBD